MEKIFLCKTFVIGFVVDQKNILNIYVVES